MAHGETTLIRLILNLLWFFLGGFASGLAWLFGGLLLALTVVGLPWAFRHGGSPATPSGRSGARSSGVIPTPLIWARAAWAWG